MERILDIFFSGLALLILSPLFLLTTIILKFSGEGEILFWQERVGKDGEIFKLLKFATMLKNSQNLGTGTITVKADTRVLPVGKFLRKTKINELPQILNILFGDMSVIGPRPLTIETFFYYPQQIQNIIKQVKPGLSGIGSIVFRGEENLMNDATVSVDFYKHEIAPYKGALEEWFVSNKSIFIYFIAIAVTIWTVFFPKTNIVWRAFKELPVPPEKLKLGLGYIRNS